ncbi:MAG TPA: hypothetical protein PK307_08575 [Spirochaetota bacterium]|nr:hypothetical protein [Spirochaetota bacterium]HPG49080.1 hypothetical protein [Spirochaetota bacterium]HPN11490.1 hypothetical protein [Spirochaetota bacterium]HQL82241.1 hypothetical protein [Spirochaetota bacterium]
MKALLDLIVDLFSWIFDFIKKICLAVFEKFMEINVFEKGTVILTILAFAAVVAPMARYMIFDAYYTINNPIAHYLIGIVLVMLVTIYFPGMISLIIRVAVNIAYLIGVIYLGAAHEISKAPYELSAGYYLNIVAPLFYIILALAGGLLSRES